MAGILVPIFLFFLLPVSLVFITRYFRYKERLLEARTRGLLGEPPAPRALPAAESERKIQDLEARIQNLESIICAVDLDQAARLNAVSAADAPRLPPVDPKAQKP